MGVVVCCGLVAGHREDSTHALSMRAIADVVMHSVHIMCAGGGQSPIALRATPDRASENVRLATELRRVWVPISADKI